MFGLDLDDREKFLKRVADRLGQAAALIQRVDRVVKARMVLTGLTVILLVLVVRETVAPWWLFLSAALFAALAILHERWLDQARARHRMAVFHRRATDRIWADLDDEERRGVPAERIRRRRKRWRAGSVDEDRVAANRRNRIRPLDPGDLGRHLDLFGPGQVFDRLADWRTDSGGETLASWLLRPASPAEAGARQEAIRELTPRVDLREALAATGAPEVWPSHRWPVAGAWAPDPPDAKAGPDPAAQARKTPAAGAGEGAEDPSSPDSSSPDSSSPDSSSPDSSSDAEADSEGEKDDEAKPEGGGVSGLAYPRPLSPREEAVCRALGLADLAALWTSFAVAAIVPEVAWMALVGILGAAIYGLMLRPRVLAHEKTGWVMESELSGLREIVSIFEREDFRSARLDHLGKEIAGAGAAISKLLSLQRRLRFRRNLLFAPLAAAFFFGSQHALAIERWRRRHGEDLEKWMRLSGEFDALLALAQYAEERPANPFAEFDDTPGLRAADLGHPLIPEERLVRNTVVLGRGEPEILVVTGSNMSGKSTLLRALGVNFLLARMGAPVNATSFRVGPVALGVSVSVQDSLQDGVSRFLAELFALRQVLDAGSAEEPLFFLLDEILQGTNSEDRRAAVFALARELARRGAVGVMTTHDLSLTELADEFPGQVKNVHFRERIEDGVMDFDYDLREGPLTRGNAFELMRMLNLPAPPPDHPEESDFTTLPRLGGDREH